jgi:hypothetical protein
MLSRQGQTEAKEQDAGEKIGTGDQIQEAGNRRQETGACAYQEINGWDDRIEWRCGTWDRV